MQNMIHWVLLEARAYLPSSKAPLFLVSSRFQFLPPSSPGYGLPAEADFRGIPLTARSC